MTKLRTLAAVSLIAFTPVALTGCVMGGEQRTPDATAPTQPTQPVATTEPAATESAEADNTAAGGVAEVYGEWPSDVPMPEGTLLPMPTGYDDFITQFKAVAHLEGGDAEMAAYAGQLEAAGFKFQGVNIVGGDYYEKDNTFVTLLPGSGFNEEGWFAGVTP